MPPIGYTHWLSLLLTVALTLNTNLSSASQQQLNEWHDLLCPGSQLPLRDSLGLPVTCLPTGDECPDKSVCWYSGFDYMCCPMDYTQGQPISPTQFQTLVKAAAANKAALKQQQQREEETRANRTESGLVQNTLIQAEASALPSDVVFGSWEAAAEALNTYGALSPDELIETDLLADYGTDEALGLDYADYATADYVDFGNFADLLPPPPPAEEVIAIDVTKPDSDHETINLVARNANNELDNEDSVEVQTNVNVPVTQSAKSAEPTFSRIGGGEPTIELTRSSLSLKSFIEQNANNRNTNAEQESNEYDYADDTNEPPLNHFPSVIMEIEDEQQSLAGLLSANGVPARVPSPILLPRNNNHQDVDVKLMEQEIVEDDKGYSEEVEDVSKKIAVEGSGYKAPNTPDAFNEVAGPAGSLISNAAYVYSTPPTPLNPTSPAYVPMRPSLQPDPEADNLFKFPKVTIAPPPSALQDVLQDKEVLPLAEPHHTEPLVVDDGSMGLMDPPVIDDLYDQDSNQVWFSPKKGVTVANVPTATEQPVSQVDPKSWRYSGPDLATVLKLAKPVAQIKPRKTAKVSHPRLRPFDRNGMQRVWKQATTERPTAVLLNPTMLKMAEHVAEFMHQQKQQKNDVIRSDTNDQQPDKVATALSTLENILRQAYKNVTRTLLKAAKIEDSEEIIDPKLFMETFRSVFEVAENQESAVQSNEKAGNLQKNIPEEDTETINELDNTIKNTNAQEPNQAEVVKERPFIPSVPSDFDKFYPLISETHSIEKMAVLEADPTFHSRLPILSSSREEPVDNWIKLPSASISVHAYDEYEDAADEATDKTGEEVHHMSLQDIIQMRRFLKENDVKSSEEFVTWAPINSPQVTAEPRVPDTTRTAEMETTIVTKAPRRKLHTRRRSRKPKSSPVPVTRRTTTTSKQQTTVLTTKSSTPLPSTTDAITLRPVTKKLILPTPEQSPIAPNLLENSLDRNLDSFDVVISRQPNLILDPLDNSLYPEQRQRVVGKSDEKVERSKISEVSDSELGGLADNLTGKKLVDELIKSRLKSSPLIPADGEAPTNKDISAAASSSELSRENLKAAPSSTGSRKPSAGDGRGSLPSRSRYTATDALNTIDEGTIYIAAPGRRSQQHLAYLIDQGWPYNPVFHRPPEYRPAPRLYGLFQSPPRPDEYREDVPDQQVKYHPDSVTNHNHQYQRWLSRYRGTRQGR